MGLVNFWSRPSCSWGYPIHYGWPLSSGFQSTASIAPSTVPAISRGWPWGPHEDMISSNREAMRCWSLPMRSRMMANCTTLNMENHHCYEINHSNIWDLPLQRLFPSGLSDYRVGLWCDSSWTILNNKWNRGISNKTTVLIAYGNLQGAQGLSHTHSQNPYR